MFNRLLRLFYDRVVLFPYRRFPTREEFILTIVLSQRTSSKGETTPFKDSFGICKSALFLLSEGIINPEEKLAVDALVHGKGPRFWFKSLKIRRRINLRALNEGNKGLTELFEEVRKGEAKLRLRPSDKRVWRRAERIRVVIRDRSGRRQLIETGRKYYNTKPKSQRKDYAVSGCIQGQEVSRILLAAQREVEQELRKKFPLEAFELKFPDGPHLSDEHESGAYAESLSINQDYDVILTVDDDLMDEWEKHPPVIHDTQITVYTAVEERRVENKPPRPGEVRLTAHESEVLGLPELMRLDPE